MKDEISLPRVPTIAPTKPQERTPVITGVDLSDGVETAVEARMNKDGSMTIIKCYRIIDGTGTGTEQK